MAANKTPHSPGDVEIKTSIEVRFDGLTVGHLEAFVKMAYAALGATADTTVYELPDNPMDPSYTVGLVIDGRVLGSSIHHFDAPL